MPTIPAPTARGARPNGATVATGATGTTGGGGARREGRSAPAVEGSAETGDAQVTPSACAIVTMELAPRVVRHDGPSARVALPFFTSNRSPAERPSPAPICAKPAPRDRRTSPLTALRRAAPPARQTLTPCVWQPPAGVPS